MATVTLPSFRVWKEKEAITRIAPEISGGKGTPNSRAWEEGGKGEGVPVLLMFLLSLRGRKKRGGEKRRMALQFCVSSAPSEKGLSTTPTEEREK